MYIFMFRRFILIFMEGERDYKKTAANFTWYLRINAVSSKKLKKQLHISFQTALIGNFIGEQDLAHQWNCPSVQCWHSRRHSSEALKNDGISSSHLKKSISMSEVGNFRLVSLPLIISTNIRQLLYGKTFSWKQLEFRKRYGTLTKPPW